MITRQTEDYAGYNAANSDLARGCHISLPRIIILSIVSMGLYWFYWMYRTWKQYDIRTTVIIERIGIVDYRRQVSTNLNPRQVLATDEISGTHYPVWHALTQFVPIYGFFRFHAHCKAYKTLMEHEGIRDSLKLGTLVAIAVIAVFLEYLVSGSLFEFLEWILGGEEPGYVSGIWAQIVSWIGIAIGTFALCWVQSNINRYWAGVDSSLAQRARFGKGEILVIIIGVILWVSTIADFIWPD